MAATNESGRAPLAQLYANLLHWCLFYLVLSCGSQRIELLGNYYPFYKLLICEKRYCTVMMQCLYARGLLRTEAV